MSGNNESLWKKLDTLPDYSMMHRLKDLQGTQQPIHCINETCKFGKPFIRWGKFGEKPGLGSNAKDWFCSASCLYEYAYRHRQEVKIPPRR